VLGEVLEPGTVSVGDEVRVLAEVAPKATERPESVIG